MKFSMPRPNSKKQKETIMSTKPNANLKAVELTQAELHSVTGGNPAAAVTALGAAVSRTIAEVGRAVQAIQDS
jgi:hypothetical protein